MKNVYLALHKVGLFDLIRRVYRSRRSLSVLLHGTYGVVFEGEFRALQFGMHVDDLEKIILWIRNHNIALLTVEEYLAKVPGIHFTIDDAYSNNYEYGLKLFEAYRVPVTIFVTTKHMQGMGDVVLFDHVSEALAQLGRTTVPETVGNELFYGLSEHQLRQLAKHPLVEIGGHTHNHPDLSKCTEEVIKNELVLNNQIIEEITGMVPKLFAYPFGAYSDSVKRIVQDVGYTHAFAVTPHGTRDLRFAIPRVGLYASDDYYLSAKLSYVRGTI